MRVSPKPVRQSLTLAPGVAKQVRSMAKKRSLSASRVLSELVEEGIEARKLKEKEFFELVERFRSATDPDESERLGHELGRAVFGT
jgi:predicted NACHT family NTPase